MRIGIGQKAFSERRKALQAAFTLVEVMIAMGIFFMAVFAILALVSMNLRNARLLQEQRVNCGMVLSQLSLTNQLTDGGSDSGDFGDLFPGYKWAYTTTLLTNGLFQVDCEVTGPAIRHHDQYRSELSVYMWKPMSVSTPTGGGSLPTPGGR